MDSPPTQPGRSAPLPADTSLPHGHSTVLSWPLAGSWILYDLANTIYATFLTYVFVDFYKGKFGSEQAVGITQTVSLVLAGVMAPVMAAICDRTGQTRAYLALFTLICVLAMAGIGVAPAAWQVLLLLAVANIGYQNALTFYPALLPSVAPADRLGLISGLGVGLGYFGTILTIVLVLVFRDVLHLGFPNLTVALAYLFFLIALPCLLFVEDRRDIPREPLSWEMVAERFRAVGATLAQIRQQRNTLLFFAGNFFLVDVLNTAIFFFGSFTTGVFRHMAEQHQLHFLGGEVSAERFKLLAGLLFAVMAMLSGVLAGWLGDRLNPLRAMRYSGWCLLIGLAGGIYAGGRSPLAYVFSMCCLGGFGLAGIWTSGRQLLVLLAPREKLGEYAGLYGITAKLSVLGCTTFALAAEWSRADLTSTLGLPESVALVLSQKEALTLQLFQIVVGLVMLYCIRFTEATDGEAALNERTRLSDT